MYKTNPNAFIVVLPNSTYVHSHRKLLLRFHYIFAVGIKPYNRYPGLLTPLPIAQPCYLIILYNRDIIIEVSWTNESKERNTKVLLKGWEWRVFKAC